MLSMDSIFALIFKEMSFAVPLFSTGVALVVPWPEMENRLFAPIRVFDQLVILFFLFYLILYRHLNNNYKRHIIALCHRFGSLF